MIEEDVEYVLNQQNVVLENLLGPQYQQNGSTQEEKNG